MWVRCSIDLDEDLETVKGYSWQIHDGHELIEIFTTSVAPDISPRDALVVVLASLQERYGSQLTLSIF